MSQRKNIVSPHDKLYRAALGDIRVAREYFENHLPKEILKVLNLNVLEPCPEIYISEHLDASESDIVYRTEIAGETGFICMAAEHQSKDEVFMPFRMLKYDVSIWQFWRDQNPQAKKLPLIINVVFFTGKNPYKSSTDFKDLLDAPKELVDAFWTKPFILIEAQNISDETLLAEKWAGIFMYFMKHIHSPDLLPHLHAILPKIKAIDREDTVKYLEAVINYGLTAGEISDAKQFIESLRESLSKSTGDRIMTGAEQLIEMGKKEGMQQGELNGERMVLKRQLSKRFGSIPSNYLEKLDNASQEILLEWIDKVIEAKTLDDVFSTRH